MTDAERGTLSLFRDLEAPRERVFRAFMEPEQLVCFWAPEGTRIPLPSIDVQPWAGGRFESTVISATDGSESRERGFFLQVVDPDRFTYLDVATKIVSTITLTDLGNDRTRLFLHRANLPASHPMDAALTNMNSRFDRLARHLAKENI